MSKTWKLIAGLVSFCAFAAVGMASAPPKPAQLVTGRIADLKVVSPQSYGGLMVFPLTGRNIGGMSYLTLDEAMADKLIEVSEVGSGDVNQVSIRNRSGKRVFIMDGEEIVGAKQNRILNTSILIGPERTVKVPVSCVEHGRWAGTSDKFSSGKTQLFAKARQANQASVNMHMAARPSAGAKSDQGQVWDKVAEKRVALDVTSSSGAMHDAYKQYDRDIDTYVKHFRPVPGQVGALFVVHGRIVGADIFDRNRTLTRLFDKMIKSYALDAIEKPVARTTIVPSRTDAEAFLKLALAKSAKFHDYDSPGEGRDVRIDSTRISGASLVASGRAVHIVLFAAEKPTPRPLAPMNERRQFQQNR